jgi:hypothetical protein
MKASHGALLFVAGGAIGFALAPRGDPSAVELVRQERDAAKVRADRAEADLATARESRTRRHDATELPKGAVAPDSREPFEDPKKAAAAPAKPDALSPEARTKRLNEIRGALAGYFAAHDGEKALAALKELAALGPEARDDAMKLALDINKDVQGAGTLRLPMQTFYTGLGDPAIRELMYWSLENQASSSADFRVMSAWSLPWAPGSIDDTIARFEGALARESDHAVQNAIVRNLGDINSPKAEAVLVRVLGDGTRDAALLGDAAMALSTSEDAAAQRAIAAVAAADASNQRVQTALKLSQIIQEPPATGCLVVQTTPDGTAEVAGIRPADLIVAYNGRAVASEGDLRNEVKGAAGAESVPVLVIRDGREQTIQVKAGRLGLPNLRPVAKK